MRLAIATLEFNNGYWVILSAVMLVLIIFFRYLFFSSLYHWFFLKFCKKLLQKRIILVKPLQKKQLLKEIYWSFISGCIFGIVGMVLYYLWFVNYTLIYTDLHLYSVWYVPLSVCVFLLLQDTYYYWIHRWMHKPKIYRYFHVIHHKSIHTNVFTSFSFHPYETILQALFLPLVFMVLPMHIYALLIVLSIMTISATINHAGIEIYPSGKFGKWFKKWIIGATHHDAHHTKFNYNYGLYFTFWDRIMHTELEDNKK